MTAEPADDKIKDLRPLQWENRILLLFPGDMAVESLTQEMQAGEAEIIDREIAWFVFGDTGVATNFHRPLADQFSVSVTERYSSGADSLEIVLIGKDGGVKGRYPRLDLPAIYDRIDSMPMRQAEMRRR